QQQPVHQGDQNQDRQDEIDHQLEGLASGRILLLKEIGCHGQSGLEHGTYKAVAVPGYWNDTLGAARSVPALSSSAACLRANMPATLTAGKTSRRMLQSVAASLNACRAKAILFSVELSSSCRASMFWLAFRSGYASDRAKSRPRMPPNWASAWLSSLMAAGALGLAATFCSAAIALLRALMT